MFKQTRTQPIQCSRLIFLLPVLSVISTPAIAHQKASLFEDNYLKVLAAVTYRNNQIVENGEIWQPNGFLIGGESIPTEKGVSLDDVQLQGYLNVNHQYYVAAKLSGHSHGGDNSVELENLWFGTEMYIAQQRLQLEAGKMTTDVTDTLNYHASADTFSQAPLSADILFGRHFNDIGVRAAVTGKINPRYLGGNSDYKIGFEVFNGDNFPATSGEGSISAFSHFNFQYDNFHSSAKFWVMYSEAEKRADLRYSQGHNHGVSQDVTAEYYFSGDTLNTGVYFDASWQYQQWRVHGEFEWMQAQVDGQIASTTQSAYIEAPQNSYRLTTFIEREQHSIHLQYEILSTQNKFTQTTPTFITQAGLDNSGFEPNRISASWRYAFHPNFVLRTEWMRDESNEPSQVNNVVSLGIQWNYDLL
ncbi:hypothetical protein GCM10009111_21350 [Colwellia asteriadis]|uniref:Porin n=1 Tax=Colwellia asteriadis TaxID=517723 RepID=A0ABN1L8E6_9GAMM